MNNIVKSFAFGAALALPVVAQASTDGLIADFESDKGYTALGVYDCWEQSPFRTDKLSGNVAVVDNPFADELNPATDEPINGSERVLAAQRSRFAGNRFGVRIDLEETFELTPTARYVHVFIHTPKKGRAMLVGLGSRQERLDQDPYCEQFWVLSSAAEQAGQWYDAVFPIKGAGGIDIRSFVIVPDCESPHDLTEDFLFYVDAIEINDDLQPRVTSDFYYQINGDKSTHMLNRNDRYTRTVSLNGSADASTQTFAVPQENDKHVYFDLTENIFTARPGESLTPVISYNGTWMHGYFYIDYNSDGRFDSVVAENGGAAADSECVAWSCYLSKDSKGTSLSSTNTLTIPSFTLPADLAPGMYRCRFKVDWNNIDAKGAPGDADTNNSVAANGGVIADLMLHVHGTEVTVNDNQLNGEVLAAEGDQKLNALPVPFKQDFMIRMNPEKGFEQDGFTMLCGYNFSGDPVDKMGNRQYFVYEVKASEISENGLYTIPAERMGHGNVMINGNMKEVDAIVNPNVEPAAPAAEGDVIYDLQGRRVKSADRAGFYIVNGQKALVR
ncbi:MAG: hypothetical protein K2G94_04645 [Muribaculaceae bacterium]|nr:hypothetical protein [Muribaculaceae bacterium]MDE5972016.1 hypothetical protein [Muribaculaceae bacterium]MDE6462398.1 hypothetical protein [Muribaculaceae bacterium]